MTAPDDGALLVVRYALLVPRRVRVPGGDVAVNQLPDLVDLVLGAVLRPAILGLLWVGARKRDERVGPRVLIALPPLLDRHRRQAGVGLLQLSGRRGQLLPRGTPRLQERAVVREDVAADARLEVEHQLLDVLRGTRGGRGALLLVGGGPRYQR